MNLAQGGDIDASPSQPPLKPPEDSVATDQLTAHTSVQWQRELPVKWNLLVCALNIEKKQIWILSNYLTHV